MKMHLSKADYCILLGISYSSLSVLVVFIMTIFFISILFLSLMTISQYPDTHILHANFSMDGKVTHIRIIYAI